jgi:hypothetical protein
MRLPNSQQRILVLGRTGSGKSQCATWHLAQRNLTAYPWIVLNHKGDDLIDAIPGAHHVDMDFFPKKPGVYIYHPVPEIDDEKVTELLWKIHARGNCGLYIDEGYMVNPRDHALTALYTQGRSKHIPMVTLSQRPSKICRFAISESDFYQVFPLADKRDRETVNAFIPYNLEDIMRQEPGKQVLLPPYHSVYYDVGKNDLVIMSPVPDGKEILRQFDEQLNPKTEDKKIKTFI